MSFRVALIVCLALVNGSAAGARAGAWDWIILEDGVYAGQQVTVHIDDAPVFPVSVRLYVGGQLVDRATVGQAGGDAALNVPSGTAGQGYQIQVVCTGSSDSMFGTVQ